MDYEKLQKKAIQREKAGKVLIYFFLLLWALVVLFPFTGWYLPVLKVMALIMGNTSRHFSPCSTLENYRQPLRRCLWQVIF